MPLELTNLEKAIDSLEEVVFLSKNLPEGVPADVIRDSVIQRFEYTFELSLKLMQRWIKLNISPEDARPITRKDLFRLAARKGLISNPGAWFDYNDASNQVAHTYSEQFAGEVYEAALRFFEDVKCFYQELEKHND